MATDGIKLMPCYRCVSRFEISQELSESRQRYGIGPSSCKPPQLSKHMGQAAPDGSFKAKHHEVCRRMNNILEVTAWLVVQLNPQMMCWHFKMPLGQCYLFLFTHVKPPLMRCGTEMMLMWTSASRAIVGILETLRLFIVLDAWGPRLSKHLTVHYSSSFQNWPLFLRHHTF